MAETKADTKAKTADNPPVGELLTAKVSDAQYELQVAKGSRLIYEGAVIEHPTRFEVGAPSAKALIAEGAATADQSVYDELDVEPPEAE